MNGIRAASEKGFWDWVKAEDPDVLCLQEIRASREQFPKYALEVPGYKAHLLPAQRPGYSGVALYTKHPTLGVKTRIGHEELDAEGRFLEAELAEFFVASVYFPSGSSGDHRQAQKYIFLDHVTRYLKDTVAYRVKPTILCGDWNIAHKQVDIKNWKSNQKNSGFLPEERAWMDMVIDELGFVDSFRCVNQSSDEYTWWSSRGQARAKNVGWRIDYQIASPDLRGRISDARIYREQNFSDHAPLTVTYQLQSVGESIA